MRQTRHSHFKINKFTAFLTLSLLCSQSSFATDDAQKNHLPLFLGGGMGLVGANASNLGTGASFLGYSLQAEATLSYQTPTLILDASLGWLYSSMSSEYELSATSSAKSHTSIVSRLGFIELSPRLRIANDFEAGPLATVYFGSEYPFGYQGVSQNLAPVFLGVKGMFNYDFLKIPSRIFAQASTDLTLEQRQIYVVTVGFEFSPIDFFSNSKPREVVKYVDKPVTVVKEMLNFVFDDQSLHFQTDADSLDGRSLKLMKDLSSYLASHSDDWESLTVEGHTDSRGSVEYNQALSERRAQMVKTLLTQQGIAESRITTQGWGPTKPLDTEENENAWELNRRVEISFTGVKDAKEFRTAISRIKTKHMRGR